MFKKLAFTLGEITIVFVVIGILSVIILHVAHSSLPNEKILKLKKANSTLFSIMRKLTSDGKHFKIGDLAYRADGTHDGDTIYHLNLSNFCNVFSEYVSAKNIHCIEQGATHCGNRMNTIVVQMYADYVDNGLDSYKVFIDNMCDRFFDEAKSGYITTTDGVSYYLLHASCGFGLLEMQNATRSHTMSDGTILEGGVDTNGFDAMRLLMCVDVDGLGKNNGTKPFGYAIRRDGKIITGARASWWLSRDLTKKETDCCPKALAESTLSEGNLCDVGDVICSE